MVLDRPLRILHVLRAPLGGLFRHVGDLAKAQSERGHLVGIIADSGHYGEASEAALKQLAAVCKLGVMRIPMSRQIGMNDRHAIAHVAARAAESNADILHGHGAKGGAYARLARTNALRAYTPHGGSLHYSKLSPLGFVYLNLEKRLAKRTDVFLFESDYSLNVFRRKIGTPKAIARVVHNGVTPEELTAIKPDKDAADVIFIGELRKLKGVDVLITALARSPHSALLFGGGPDAEAFHNEVAKRGLASRIQFAGPMPAREAFRRGRVLVVPSRAESLPYIVLEAAAGSVPLIATQVGGIPEIFGSDVDALIQPNDPAALAAAIDNALIEPPLARTARLHARVAASFTVSAMTDGVLAAYGEAMRARAPAGR
ncbi:MAG TPA: glycosyltransferase [Xanthobacteraceae bacterium]|nr:glycosyltransferase [Xanthobacteraceae bacterium]